MFFCTAQEAISNEKLFVFGELLDLPAVQAMAADAVQAPVHKLLELFAYGKHADAKEAGLPPLTPAQVRARVCCAAFCSTSERTS
eukprot:SAG22_NODE_1207_length_5166_cov_4.472272_1_plen_85_part_00